MNGMPVPEGRPVQRGEGGITSAAEGGITSAESHPELVSGDLATTPRPHVSITSVNRSIVSDRARWTMRVLAIVAVPVVLAMFMSRKDATSHDGGADKQTFARACIQWHLAAGTVVSRLIQSTRDADLAQVGDSVFRMRRARRNCEAGWVTLACQDYHAVAAGMPGYAMTNQLFPCPRTASQAMTGIESKREAQSGSERVTRSPACGASPQDAGIHCELGRSGPATVHK
ncbi:MAG: hypothetical protein GEU95_00150 [Rhizobiales bacterium]|nr:hypothetical protein [Hyphomicrobiales bacterium]